MILIEEEAVLVENRRAGRPVIVVDDAELAMPDDLAVQVERHQPVTAKRRVDHVPVGHRRRRRVTVLLVHVLDAVLRNKRLPQLAAIGTIERQQRQLAAALLRGRQ